MIRRLVFILALLPTVAFAQQQQPDPAALQKAIAILQAQRNQAMDAAASSELNAQKLSEENAKLKADLADLKKKDEAPKEGAKP